MTQISIDTYIKTETVRNLKLRVKNKIKNLKFRDEVIPNN